MFKYFLLLLRCVRLSLKPNPQPLPFEERGVRIKASLEWGRGMEEGFQASGSNFLELIPDIRFFLRFLFRGLVAIA